MTGQHDLDRTLGAWLGAEAAPAPPPEPLARTLGATSGLRPRPALVAGLGSHWIGGARYGARAEDPRLRLVLVLALAALLAVALVGGAALVGGRLVAPHRPPIQDTYRDEFVSLPGLAAPMAWSQVVPLLDGRVLVMGRGGDGGDPVTALTYDPASGTSDQLGRIAGWTFVDSAIRLLDGRVLLLGDGAGMIFDPSTRRFDPVGPMVDPRRAPAALLQDGRVLIAGGMTPGGGYKIGGPLTAELFAPETLSFTATGSLGAPVGSMTTMPDGRVFTAPEGPGDTAQVYDPKTGSFSAAGAMPAGYAAERVISLPNGRVVVFGNETITINSHHWYSLVWDPTSPTFSAAHDTPGQVVSATLLDDGRILVYGGNGVAVAGMEWSGIYDVVTGVTPLPQKPTSSWPTAARLADGRVIIVGGVRDGGLYPDADGGLHDAPPVGTVEIFQ